MKIKRKMSIMLALLMVILVLNACSGNSTDGTDGKAAAKDTLLISANSDPVSLDPWHAMNRGNMLTKSAIYERLFITNTEGEIEPQLAESWEWSDDYSTLTVNLRKGVYFHNGEEMKANDVKYSLERAGESPIVYAQVDYIDYSNIKVIDDYTVEIPFTTPTGIAEKCLAGTMYFIVNEKFAKEKGEDLTFVGCGTGPWMLEKFTPGIETTFKRFEDYWGELTTCSSMVLRVIEESSQALLELENGNIDIIVNPDMASVESVANGSVKNAKLYKQPAHMNIAFYLNMDLEPTNNKLVRQALFHAINIDDAVAAGYQNLGTRATSFISKNVSGYDNKYANSSPYPYNPEKAKELLAEAGYPNGFEMNIYVASSNKERVVMAEVIQNNLAQIGIKVNVKSLEYSSFRAALMEGKDTHAFLFGVTATTGEANNALYERFYENMGESVGLYGWQKQGECTEVSRLLKEARETFDDQERLDIYAKVQELLFETVPVIPLSEQTYDFILADNCYGFESTTEYYWTGGVYFK